MSGKIWQIWLLLLLVCCAQPDRGRSKIDWDQDNDGYLSTRELASGGLAFLDKNKDGKAGSAEFAEGVRRIRLLQEFDQNKDGRVTRMDFVFLFPDGGLWTGEISTGTFSLWDKDQNDEIDGEELAAGLLQRYDSDSNKSLDLDEAQGIVEQLELVEALDLDRDGKISMAETSRIRVTAP